MRIACPRCAATYEVPDSRLKPGKVVRCARCGANWTPEPAATEPQTTRRQTAAPLRPTPPAEDGPPPEPLPPVAAMDRLAAAAPPPPQIGLIAAWVASVVLLTAAIGGAFVWRDTMVRAWPPLGRILTVTAATPGNPEREPPPHPGQPTPQAEGAQTTGRNPE